MTAPHQPRPLFRPEAVAHHARSARAGSVLGLSRRALAVPFWLLLAAVVAAACSLFVVHADERARGAARLSGTTEAVVYLPVAVAGDLRPGMVVRLARAGDPALSGRLLRIDEAVTGDAVARALGLATPPPGLDAAVAATVRLSSSPSATAPAVYRADVVLRRQPIGRLLVPGLKSLIGRRG
jgi:hypothetical protein